MGESVQVLKTEGSRYVEATYSGHTWDMTRWIPQATSGDQKWKKDMVGRHSDTDVGLLAVPSRFETEMRRQSLIEAPSLVLEWTRPFLGVKRHTMIQQIRFTVVLCQQTPGTGTSSALHGALWHVYTCFCHKVWRLVHGLLTSWNAMLSTLARVSAQEKTL